MKKCCVIRTLDRDANLFLLEVNMSPNLSSGHFPPNAQLYRYVLRNMWQLIGTTPEPRLFEWEVTICPTGVVDCNDKQFQFCRECLTDTQLAHLNQINIEHRASTNYKRASPNLNRPISVESKIAQFQRDYFTAKCSADRSWC